MSVPAGTLAAWPVVFYGGTGQAIVNREILRMMRRALVLVVDDTPGLRAPFADVPLVQGLAGLDAWLDAQSGTERPRFHFVCCIGNPHGRVRLSLAQALESRGGVPLTLVHPTAVIASDALIGAGAQIMAGAIVQPRVVLGAQTIVNTRASIDHECRLGDGVEVGPGATLCGAITVRDGAWIAAGATVLPRCEIGADAIVGAGALVRRDVPAATTVVGVPATPLKEKGR